MPKIELAIQNILNDICKGNYHGDEAWTKAIMNECTRLADSHNYDVYGQKCDIDDTITECLYDMVWFTHRQLNYLPAHRYNIIFGEIHLVMECEWKTGIDEIMYDFQKLVQARAHRRVMIFQSYDPAATIKILTDYVKSVSHSTKGDRYLFAGYKPQDEIFNFESFVKG